MLGEYWKIDTTIVGLASSAYFFTYTLFQVPINNYLKKKREDTVFLKMGIAALMVCFLFVVSKNFIMIIGAMLLMGIVIGSLFTYCSVYASEQAPFDHKGIHMGVFNSIMPLTDIVSPIISTISFDRMVKLPFCFSLIFFIIYLIIVRGYNYHNKAYIISQRKENLYEHTN